MEQASIFYIQLSPTFVEEAVFSPSYVLGVFVKNQVKVEKEKVTRQKRQPTE
jgi:hypothetical protein